MRIRKFKTDIYAGLKDLEVSFEPGLNVVYGPNEAGKSTLVEAIHATIFQEHNLRMNRNKDKEFKKRFMPHPEGNYINGSLIFEVEEKIYRLKKEWGETSSVEMELPDGTLLKDYSRISTHLVELFQYGEATYGRVVFARQLEVKKAIERIISSSRVAETVSSFLRNAIMELDGVSIDRLKTRIDEELNKLLKRWDYENGRPENPNRDINNPYKVGCGEILEAYYQKENLKRKIKETRQIEEDFADLSNELKELDEKREAIQKEIDKLKELESDIFRRGRIEPEIKRLEEQYTRLKQVNSEWPKKEEKLKHKNAELEKKNEELKKLKEKKEKAEKAEVRKRIKTQVDQISKLRQKINKKNKKKNEIKEIPPEEIDRLEDLQQKINESRAAMKAATLIGNVNYAEDIVHITRGVEKKETIEPEVEFRADGFLRIEIKNTLDLEIRSGEIDFKKLEKDFREARKEFEALLNKLEVKGLKEARQKREELTKINSEVENLEKQTKQLLKGQEFEELKSQLLKLKEYDTEQSIEEIVRQLEKIDNSELMAEIKTLENDLKNWQKEYDSPDSLLDKLVEIKNNKNKLQQEIEELHEVPDSFESPEEFKKYLDNLRARKEKLDNTYSKKREKLYDIEKELPEVSSEELENYIESARKNFDRLQLKAERIKVIKSTFEKVLKREQKDPFQPLVKTFSKYLMCLTDDKYSVKGIEQGLEPEIENKNGVSVPIDTDYLSFGTYDGVALALRFALLKQLFADRRGLVVLDDCLTNLDPERRKNAVKLIREASENNQIIFSTCDPRTAKGLGGRQIELD